jgi:hypothetical protein
MTKILQAGAVILLLGLPSAPLLAQSPTPPPAVFPKRSVAIAFLGSRLKLKTYIAPLLEKYHFRATLFVDDPAPPVVDDLGTGERHLTWPEIAGLSGTFEIGNFTAHPEDETGGWYGWPRPEQIRQLEVVEQRCNAAGLGKPSMIFYPQGVADPSIFQFLSDRGYSMGLTLLPPRVIDFYNPVVYHPLLVPCLMDPTLFYEAVDKVRSQDFPRDRILVIVFDPPHTMLSWEAVAARLSFLSKEKFNVLSIGDLAGYAGDAMRATRYWDMRYAESGSGLRFTLDPRTQHWYMVNVAPLVSVPRTGPPEEPAASGALAMQLERRIMPQVNFDRMPLEACIDALGQPPAGSQGQTAPVSFVVEPAVDVSTPITLHLINTPYTEVLRYISRLAGVTFSIERYAITVNTPANRTGNIGTITPGSMNRAIDFETTNISHLDFTDASVDAVMNLLSRKLNDATGGSIRLTFVADPALNVSKAVTLHVKNMPFMEVLRYVGDLAATDFAIEQYAIYARPKPPKANEPAPDVYAAPTPFALVR